MSTWQDLRKHPDRWNRYFIRERTINAIRGFFAGRGFHEVETPILLSNPPAESYLELFETTLLDRNRQGRKAYLSTSPETSLKKLLVAGIGDCYSLTKSFRNTETGSVTHNPEFTILEWYRVGSTYTDSMDDCEKLVQHLAESVLGHGSSLTYRGNIFGLESPWERISVTEAMDKWAGVDLEAFFDREKAVSIAREKGYAAAASDTWESLFNQIFLNEVEPHLGRDRPSIIYDFPAEMGALARKKKDDPRFAERFEFYIGGLELGDCYGELTDPDEQQNRFDAELAEIRRQGKTQYDYDHDFIEALKLGLPDCSGVAVGVDRLVMLLADVASVQETLFFPADELFGLKGNG